MPTPSNARTCLAGALLCILLALAGCQASVGSFTVGAAPASLTPTLPSGWTWYHDSVYPFDAPVPPGWQAHGFWHWVSRTPEKCQREVDLVPPVSQAGYVSNPDRVPEIVKITVANTCPDFVPARDNHWLTPAGTSTIAGASAAVYTAIDDVSDQRVAIARFGGRQYVFNFYNQYGGGANARAHDAAQVALYATILKGFVYHGK